MFSFVGQTYANRKARTNPSQGGLFQQVVTEEAKESSSDEEADEPKNKKQENPDMDDPENPF